jgi:uncharacterized protein (DUF362 family)
MSKVAIVQEHKIEEAIAKAMAYFDFESRVYNKIVAVKPNETWASKDDLTAVTQPDSLRAVLRFLKQFQPKDLIVTGGSGAGETDEIFRIAGLMQVVEEEQATFFDHNRPPFQEVKLEYAPGKDVAGPQQFVMVNPRVLTYETLVTLNQLKVHETATVTLSLKNIAMSYPAADYYGHPRGSYKRKHEFFSDMHSFIAAMAKRFPAQFAVTVGHPAMIGLGPIGGYTFETGIAIASDDPVAADVVGAQLLGFTADGVHHIWEAGKLGLGETDVEKITFSAMNMETAFGAFTKAAYGKKLTLAHA